MMNLLVVDQRQGKPLGKLTLLCDCSVRFATLEGHGSRLAQLSE